ncbi:EamA family transporter [Massilia solisilvae]|uniref:EamA family transporter n=1 Tax=Massilia solisilvae TaxID=1811225 RepID=A0ABT2BLM3_9BURK|nr:EamA family transporter [Massilia solisilvae]MCS0609415.1 EamA family transporter [Massilia solisilvae]
MPSSALFAIASIIWGSTFWAITLELGEVPPAVSVVYRFGLASSALFATCLLRGGKLMLPWRAQKWMMLQGLLTFCVSYVCTYNAEQHVVSALVAVLFALMVFWTPVCARVGLGTPLSPRTFTAGMAAIAGVTMLFWQSIGEALQELTHGGTGGFLLGAALAVVASIASSAGSVVVTKVREQSSNLMLTMAWSMLWGTLFVALWCVATGQPFVLPAKPSYYAGLIYLSLFGSVIAFFAYFTLINRIGSQKAVYTTVISPVISVLLSIRLEHFRPGLVEWLGIAVCLGSVAWALRAPAAKPVSIRLDNAIETTP